LYKGLSKVKICYKISVSLSKFFFSENKFLAKLRHCLMSSWAPPMSKASHDDQPEQTSCHSLHRRIIGGKHWSRRVGHRTILRFNLHRLSGSARAFFLPAN
jgi:hypothetical protein